MALTAQQMVEDLWERIGEPSDLDPFGTDGETIDTDSEGWEKMLRALNRGITAAASFRDTRTGRLFRYRNRHAWQYVTFTPASTTLTAAITAGDLTVQFAASGAADTYNDYLVKVGTEVRLIVDDDGAGTCTVSKSFDSAHASGATIYYAPRYLTITTSGNNFVEVASVFNMEESTTVERGERGDLFNMQMDSDGDPTQYYRVGDKLYLDRVQFDDTQGFRVDYLRLPGAMTAVTDTSGLPEAFDEAIISWAMSWGFSRYISPDLAAAARSQFVAEMRMHQTEWHVDDEFSMDTGGYLRSDY